MDAGEVRRATWVCGDQYILIEEVVDAIRAHLRPAEIDYVSVSAGPHMDRTVWTAANQYPMDPGVNRLIMVRDAEQLTRWELLHKWLGRTRQLPRVYLLFISNETDLPYRAGKQLMPHVAALKAPRGHVVRCAMPNEADAVAWIRRRSHLDDDAAWYLLTRTGGNLAEAAAVCTKLNLFTGRAATETIDALCRRRPGASFVDSLIMLDKRGALDNIAALTETDDSKIIGLLESRLDLLAALHRLQSTGLGYRDSGINPFLLRQYLPHARHHDPARCVHRRRVLAVVDDALRNGARDGVWEALVALW